MTFVKTIGPPNAAIMLVGEAPGETEDATGLPFVGSAGKTLDRLLRQANLSRHECLIANVARERPPGNKIAFYYEDKKNRKPKPILQDWINLLKEEIEFYKPNIIVALGRTAAFHLCGIDSIESARGFITESTLVPGKKVLPTYHPQAVNYQWKLFTPTVMDLRKAAHESLTPDLPKLDISVKLCPSLSEFLSYLEWLREEHEGPIAVDIETIIKNGKAFINTIGIADSPTSAYSITLFNGPKHRFSADNETMFWTEIAETFKQKEIIGHNYKFDFLVLWSQYGVWSNLVHDTLIASHICWPELPRSLRFVSSICLNTIPWKHLSAEDMEFYNAMDVINTYGCWEVLEKEIDRLGQREIYQAEMKQCFPAMYMEQKGLYFNLDKRKVVSQKLNQEINVLQKEVNELAGRDINVRSPKQLNNLLYVELGLPVQYKRRKSVNDPKKVTTNAEALTTLSMKSNNPLLDKIIELKKLQKLQGFVDIPVSPKSRVHTCYNVTGANMSEIKKDNVLDEEGSFQSFGRWSSSKSIIFPWGSGNHQNIPKKARKLYTAPEGMVYIQADYIQAEAVVVSFLAGDQIMKNVYIKSFGLPEKERKEKGYDTHRISAAMMFGVNYEDVTSEQRSIGKVIRHATSYGAGPAVVANQLRCALNDAKQKLSMYHTANPLLRAWHQKIQATLREKGELVNLFGRRHKFLNRWGDQLFRSAYSYIPQSTVGDLMNRSLVRIYENHGDWIDIALQLHDAVYVIVEERDVDKVISTLRKEMYHQFDYKGEKFAIDINFEIGPSWGDMVPYETKS